VIKRSFDRFGRGAARPGGVGEVASTSRRAIERLSGDLPRRRSSGHRQGAEIDAGNVALRALHDAFMVDAHVDLDAAL
jgi:hypothetical protein